MKRLLNIALLLALALFGASAQVSLKATDVMAPPANGTFLNGTGAYHFRTSPSKMDLNGSEKVTNPGFETYVSPNFTGWERVTAGTTTVDTSYQSRTGSYAVKIVMDASNSLGQVEQYVSVTPGLKYTFEVWHKVAGGADSIQYMLYDSTNNRSWVQSSQTWSAGTIPSFSASSGTYAKTVANFVAQPGAINIQIRLTRKGTEPAAASVFFDDVSLTQAWDLLVLADIKPSVSGAFNEIFSVYNGAVRYEFRKSNTEKLQSILHDGNATPTAQSSGNISTGVWTRVASVLDRTGSATNYIAGVSDGASSIAGQGKFLAWSVADIGIHLADPSRHWNGQIGEVIVVRYSSLPTNIGSWITAASNSRLAIPFPPLSGGGEIVFWTDWQSGGYDKSGNGNHLTPVGGASWGPIQ